jgi:hypothetical protein
MAFQTHSEPCGFNPHYRQGFGEEVSRKYALLCKNNRGLTRALRKRAYRVIADLIEDDFPTTVQLGTFHPGCWETRQNK